MESRAQAQAAIKAGKVAVDGVAAKRASQTVYAHQSIEAVAVHPWASRGGLKLEAALDEFQVNVSDRVCLDLGASTGGFTDVLLARGAAQVIAVDVGRDQLVERLKTDARVVSLEGMDARDLSEDLMPAAPSLIVVDVSFIGLEKALPAALALAASPATLIALFKPQFQVGPDHIGKGGQVKDVDAVAAAEGRFDEWLVSVGWEPRQWMDSPILGGAGAKERLVLAERI